MLEIIIAIILNFIASYISYRKSSLSFNGYIAAFLLGSLIYIFGGFFSWFLMGAFFISSSLLSKYQSEAKKSLKETTEKGDQRDYLQVLANGGVGLICALLYRMTQNPVYSVAFASAFAASNADTWASELGVLSKKPPVMLHTLKQSEKGSSGSVSILGLTASFFGASFIAVLYCFNYLLEYHFKSLQLINIIIIIFSGFLGSLLDSILGALLQANYRCEVCQLVTEKRIHHDRPTIKIKGFVWINNDFVNFISIAFAAVIAGALYMLTN